jgi:hypothetical protein
MFIVEATIAKLCGCSQISFRQHKRTAVHTSIEFKKNIVLKNFIYIDCKLYCVAFKEVR